MMTLKEIAQTAGIRKSTALKLANDKNWLLERKIIKGRLTNVYNITLADVCAAIAKKAESLQHSNKRNRMPFDAGWDSNYGEAPTLTILKKLDELTAPWGAHPAKSLIKKREIFSSAA